MSHGSKDLELHELLRLARTMRDYAVEASDLHYAEIFFDAAAELESRAAVIALSDISAMPRLLPHLPSH